jgi:DNA-binding winged helix-turn-helix (wHTH) protein/TolB-like protein
MKHRVVGSTSPDLDTKIDEITPNAAAPARLSLGEFELDTGRRVLVDQQGQPVELRVQAYEVLQRLAMRPGALFTKDELMNAVWPGVVVTDDSLVQAISDIRRALGEAGPRIVKTIPRRGYMLLAEPAVPTARVRSRGRTVFYGLMAGILLTAGYAWLQRSSHADSSAVGAFGRRASIAVLAFKGAPGDSDGDVIARDVAAELASELARSPDLRVVSSQSSFQFAARVTPLAEVGQRLRSRYIVDGAVRREGEQLRIGVDLIDSQDGRIVWSSSSVVDRVSSQATQRALVSRVAGTLQSRVDRSEQRLALAEPLKSLDAYVLVARGRAALQMHSAQGVRESRELFGRALAIDSGYARAWAFLGLANIVDIGLHLTGEWDQTRTGDVFVQVRRAIALQPDLPIAYYALAQAQLLAGDFDAMLATAHQLCNLSPNDADCFYTLGSAQMRLGRVEDATRNFEAALDRNPVPPAQLPAFYATALWGSRRFAEALRATDDCLAKAPEFWRCRQDRIVALVELSRAAEAHDEANRLLAQVPKMNALQFGAGFAASASALHDRRVAAARAAGFP